MSAQLMSSKTDTSHWASYLGFRPFLSIMLVVDKKQGTIFGRDSIVQKKRSVPIIYSTGQIAATALCTAQKYLLFVNLEEMLDGWCVFVLFFCHLKFPS